MKYNEHTLLKWEKYSFKTDIEMFGKTVEIKFFSEAEWNKKIGDDSIGLQRTYANDILVLLKYTIDTNELNWRYTIETIRNTLVHELGHFISQNGFFSGMEGEEVLAESCAVIDSYRHQINRVMKELTDDIKRFKKAVK